jgi:cytochrome c-type biogenesis protein CcsB
LDNIGYKAIALGFPLFSLGGLVFGAVWAQHAWGRYWGWDPKETWLLISWLFYALYLHVRVRWGWSDVRTAWLAVAGFGVAMFTWWGVNYLLSGLHSYAG